VKPVTQLESKFAVFVLLVGICFAIPVTTLFTILKIIFPCTSATIGYRFIPECLNLELQTAQWSNSSNALHALICLLIFWMAIDATGCFAMFVIDCSIMQAFCLRRYLKNLTGMMDLYPKHILKYLRLYRKLQILSRY